MRQSQELAVHLVQDLSTVVQEAFPIYGDGKNIRDWLKEEKQSDDTIKSLWEIIAVGALNTNIDKASAFMFREILMKIFS